ncbi:hypothetical protein SDRG_00545 [Saprolegnia diclina VS20]|uniref:Ricin B lectin domain-containing protein n=1 Tax=Saprolegnia diclina (strain VS20) TaxID=1156394 RepID=T0R7A3_SAPDV|nr:hypothetical protein SDRG_00545 [Saprolegnia diclina VS20]EQC42826.1 hypothetical protein SDRG_00545 [Saprolegnia diclina VS20]|eukprot:XP_008604249.1 hypothetical protein SDRG_00545 [Saprolegnia diclina VS20]
MLPHLPLLALGALSASVVADKLACGVSPGGWTQVPGDYLKVAYDGKTLCAIDLQYKLACASSTTSPIPWSAIPGEYADIGLANGILYARKHDVQGTMVVTNSVTNVQWATVNLNYGAEKQTSFAFDGSTLCEATDAGRFVCTSTAPGGIPYTWTNVDGSIVRAAVRGSTLYGVDATGQLLKGTTASALASGKGQWEAMSNNSLSQVSYDGSQLCGVDKKHQAHCTTGSVAATPPSQCCFKDGDVIQLQSDTGKYLGRCGGGCIPGASYPDSAFVHVSDPWAADAACGRWAVKNVGNGKITLQSDSGRYLARCYGCATRAKATYPDEAFVHSTDPTTAFTQWKCIDAGNGKIGLQSDTGNYLARCNNCFGTKVYPDVAFVHAKSWSDGAYAQWTVYKAKDKPQASQCPVPAPVFSWQSLPGEWESITSYNGNVFGIDTTNRLFTRTVSATAKA